MVTFLNYIIANAFLKILKKEFFNSVKDDYII